MCCERHRDTSTIMYMDVPVYLTLAKLPKHDEKMVDARAKSAVISSSAELTFPDFQIELENKCCLSM